MPNCRKEFAVEDDDDVFALVVEVTEVSLRIKFFKVIIITIKFENFKPNLILFGLIYLTVCILLFLEQARNIFACSTSLDQMVRPWNWLGQIPSANVVSERILTALLNARQQMASFIGNKWQAIWIAVVWITATPIFLFWLLLLWALFWPLKHKY